ncbi:MAG TPA: glycosyltransferase family 4 protein [Anaerolineae bacterium]|nr:glycosyltransferase family 4 protein [Anaerolineae bacterium]
MRTNHHLSPPSSRPHILFLSTWYPFPADNGSKIRVHHLLQALSAHYDVTLVAFAFATAQPDTDYPLPHVATIKLNPYQHNQAPAWQTFLSLRPISSRPIPAMQQLITSITTQTQFSAVIASTEMMSSYAYQLEHIPVKILEEHNSFTRMMADRYHNQTDFVRRLRCWLSWQKIAIYERWLFRQFDLITMVSELDGIVTQQLAPHPERVAVIPNGVDTQTKRPQPANKMPFSLIYNGALTYQANYDAVHWFLTAMMPTLKQLFPSIHLTITGSTKGVDLANLPLDNSVTLTGYIDDIAQTVAQSAICVVPLRVGGGTRLKILEAMACGTPVVTTTKGAEGLTIQPNHNILIADTPHDFINAIKSLFDNPQQAVHIAQQARTLVEQQYDWARLGEQFVTIINQTIVKK